jgi:hypothetical protein
MIMGQLRLTATGDQTIDACFQLVSNPPNNKPVFSSFASLRFTKKANAAGRSPPAAAAAAAGERLTTYQGRNAQEVPAVQLQAASVVQAVQLSGGTPQAVQQASRVRRAAGVQPRTADRSNIVATTSALPGTIDNQFTAPASNRGDEIIPVAQPAAVLDLGGQYSWLAQGLLKQSSARPSRASSTRAHLAAAAAAAWEQLRMKYALPQGQEVLESLWSPYDTEDLAGCPDCQPII